LKIACVRRNERYGDWDVYSVLDDAWIECNAPEWKSDGVCQPPNAVERNVEIPGDSVVEGPETEMMELKIRWMYDGTDFYSERPASILQAAELTEAKAAKLAEIQSELDSADLKLARPTQAIVEAIMSGLAPDAGDRARFAELTARKAELRALAAAVSAAGTVEEVPLGLRPKPRLEAAGP
jgi:hypothetical protein